MFYEMEQIYVVFFTFFVQHTSPKEIRFTCLLQTKGWLNTHFRLSAAISDNKQANVFVLIRRRFFFQKQARSAAQQTVVVMFEYCIYSLVINLITLKCVHSECTDEFNKKISSVNCFLDLKCQQGDYALSDYFSVCSFKNNDMP